MTVEPVPADRRRIRRFIATLPDGSTTWASLRLKRITDTDPRPDHGLVVLRTLHGPTMTPDDEEARLDEVWQWRYWRDKNSRKRRVAIYYRVGSDSKATKGQQAALRRWVTKHGPGKENQWYRDRFAGNGTERPALEKLIDDIERDRVNKLVVWRLDRLGFNGKWLYWFFRTLQRRGVGLESICDEIDISSDEWRELIDVMGPVFMESIPMVEAEIQDEEVGDGQRVATAMEHIRKHRKIARSSKVTEEMAERLCRMYVEGHSQTKIAAELGVTRQTVGEYLRRAEFLEDNRPLITRRSLGRRA